MPDKSAILALPYIQPAQAQKHVTHNEALARLDVLVQLSVAGFGAQVAPSAPAEGETHALGDAPTGVWAGQGGMLATWRDGVWSFVAPQAGWRAWSAATRELRVWDGSGWMLPPAGTQNLAGVGVNTASDGINRLSVRAGATLLSHEGADHRLKINKAAAGDTASLLFQSGWTGHAEMGLGGDVDFSIKVSGDGAGWTEALRIDAATGTASGAAVQGGATDTGAGRLMPVGAFGLGADALPPEIGDVDATGTAAGFYGYTGSTPNAASLPGTLAAGSGIIRVERGADGGLAQTAWRGDGQGSDQGGGRWWRGHGAGGWGAWRRLYDSANIVAPVAQSAGTPTGGVVERGSNTDGEYVRFADGTQICTNSNAPITTAPAPFVGTITRIDGDKLWIGTWF